MFGVTDNSSLSYFWSENGAGVAVEKNCEAEPRGRGRSWTEPARNGEHPRLRRRV